MRAMHSVYLSEREGKIIITDGGVYITDTMQKAAEIVYGIRQRHHDPEAVRPINSTLSNLRFLEFMSAYRKLSGLRKVC